MTHSNRLPARGLGLLGITPLGGFRLGQSLVYAPPDRIDHDVFVDDLPAECPGIRWRALDVAGVYDRKVVPVMQPYDNP